MANDITIKVTADTKDVKTGFSAAKGEIAGLQSAIQQLSLSISTSANAIKSTLTTISEILNKSKAPESGERTKKMIEGVKGAADLAATGFKALGIEIPEIGPIVGGVTAVVEGFFALCGSMSDQLGSSWTDNEKAIKSLKSIMADALAPTLKVILNGITGLVNAFVESYKQGGLVSQIFEVLSVAAAAGGAAFNAVKDVLSAFWSAARDICSDLADLFADLFGVKITGSIRYGTVAINLIKDAFIIWKSEAVIAIDVIKGYLEAAIGIFKAAAKFVQDVFTVPWNKVEADWKAGTDRIAAQAKNTAQKIAVEVNNIKGALAAGFHLETPAIRDTKPIKLHNKDGPDRNKNGKLKKLNVKAPAYIKASTADVTTPVVKISTPAENPPPLANATAKANNSFPSITGAANKPVEISQAGIDATKEAIVATFEKIDLAGGKTANDQKTKWKSVADSIAGAFSSSLQGMIKGTQNFRGMMLNIGNAILGEATKWIQKKASAFLIGELTQTAATATGVSTRTGIEAAGAATSTGISATTALAQIGHSAAVAAAGAYAAIAKIDFIGPVLAPLAAAAALAGVLALGKSIFSAEGGMGQVPYDGAMFELHKDEMVLPASLAKPMRSMLLNPASNINGPIAGNDGGVTHNHYYDIKGMDGQDVHRVLMRHQSSVARAAERAYRNGYKPK